jgi:hypothetical protein
MKNINRVLCLALALIMIATSPALADKGGKGKSPGADHGKSSFEWPWNRSKDDTVVARINTNDRKAIRQLIRQDAFRHCPPGLAKKSPPCVPPGQAKKYKIGSVLPDGVVYSPVPPAWGLHAPDGYQYVKVDKDVLLISEASKKIIDAVTLLSAVS